MAYTKQTWQDLPNTTSPITATRLNHMEDGIETANTLKGGLIAYGCIWLTGGSSSSSTLDANTMYGFGDLVVTRYHNETNYIDDILVYDSTAKTYKVNTKGVVGYVKTTMVISGQGNSNTSGIWFSGQNKDTLPTGVRTMENMGMGGLICFQKGSAYSGASNELDYQVTATDNVSFTLNPKFESYGGTLVPSVSGTLCFLKVEVYAKYE